MTSVGGMAKAVPPFKWRFHATEILNALYARGICAIIMMWFVGSISVVRYGK